MKLITSRKSHLSVLCADKDVLHIGCADSPFTTERLNNGTLLHAQIDSVAKSCLGVDFDCDAIQTLRSAGYDVACIDVEQLVETPDVGRFDCIVAGEVLEHLSNPGVLVATLRKLLRANGELIVTVPNAFFVMSVIRVLLGSEKVHHEHVSYYSEKTISTLLTRYGFDISSCDFSFEFSEKPIRRLLKLPIYWLCKLNPRLGQSVIVVATASVAP